MSYELCFSESLFTGEDETEITDKPRSILEAIENMPLDEKIEMTQELFPHLRGQHFGARNYVMSDSWSWDILDIVRKTNACRDLRSPVKVYIDDQFFFSVDVYD